MSARRQVQELTQVEEPRRARREREAEEE